MKRQLTLLLWTLLALTPLKSEAQINTERMMNIGRNALYFDDYVLSIQYFNMVISAKPYLHEPYFYRGLAKFYLDDYQGAREDCTKAIERNPFFPNSYQVRGLSLINLGLYAEAAADYEVAIEMEPNNNALWNNLVLCRIETEETDKADSLTDQMVKKWPKDPRCYTLKTQIWMLKADTATAEKWLDKAIDIDPYDASSLAMKSQFLMRREDYTAADSTLTKAIHLEPRNVRNIINRALCRYQMKNLRGAMADYDTALDIDPDNFIGHYNRGLLRAQVGDDNRAIEDFDFIIRIDPDDIMSIFNRAQLLDKTGDYRAAIRDYTTVIKAYPKFLHGYQLRAEARKKIGDTKGALADEDHILREQIAHRFGYSTPTSRQKNVTRKKSQVNLDDYNKLVTEDEQDSKTYESEYRGKVQNRNVEAQLLPLYALTYNFDKKAIREEYNYQQDIDKLNRQKLLPEHLLINNNDNNITEEEFHRRMASVEALRKKGNSATNSLALSIDYYILQDYENAINALDEAISQDGNSTLAFFQRGVVRAKMTAINSQSATTAPNNGIPAGQPQRMNLMMVKADLTQAIQLDPSFTLAYYNRACVEYNLGDYKAAIDDFNKAIDMKNDFPQAYYNRGLTRIAMGETDAGVTDLSKAGEQGIYTAYSLIKKYTKPKANK